MTERPPLFPSGTKLVPVLTIHEARHAVPVARALAAGGISSVEITLRTAAAADAIRANVAELPEVMVGVGTVLSPADYDLARKLGARFALSPGATPRRLDAAAAATCPLFPGSPRHRS